MDAMRRSVAAGIDTVAASARMTRNGARVLMRGAAVCAAADGTRRIRETGSAR